MSNTNTMKIKTTIAAMVVLIGALAARGNLIDLTPGGFDFNQGFPKPFLNYVGGLSSNTIQFFDAASPTGWTNTGVLNGGTFFNTTLIGNPGISADVMWNFATLPPWNMQFLLVEGSHYGNVYAVPPGFRVSQSGAPVTLFGNVPIAFIEFAGKSPSTAVSDSGSSVALMGLGLLGLAWFGRFRRVSKEA